MLHKKEDITVYCSEIQEFVAWCDPNLFILNVKGIRAQYGNLSVTVKLKCRQP